MRTHTPTTNSKKTARPRVDELILSGPTWQSGLFLSPVLSKLASEEEQRWLTLILSDHNPGKTIKWLKSEGISSCNVRVLNRASRKQSLDLTYKALACGTSHTVISWINEMDQEDLSKLEDAARSGRCNCLTIRSRDAA
ncbi:hypothetical protein GZ77_02975 [Endozoicomonas montiporae]|uniref:Cell division inhibitor SulA n=2 Tax=Endozoicomonas montiporae TaxID=1027273 RepID=A0A081NAW5_9GAMM|nr:hypothetical protein [Endozoicomonas montiporae]AMO56713.1 cell division inhibitor-like protein [Endozoicomonas montiporae CL-33]KEQ15588.1 hypothetical protein GZ77_02975 [Endozoicomonas montiporae]